MSKLLDAIAADKNAVLAEIAQKQQALEKQAKEEEERKAFFAIIYNEILAELMQLTASWWQVAEKNHDCIGGRTITATKNNNTINVKLSWQHWGENSNRDRWCGSYSLVIETEYYDPSKEDFKNLFYLKICPNCYDKKKAGVFKRFYDEDCSLSINLNMFYAKLGKFLNRNKLYE